MLLFGGWLYPLFGGHEGHHEQDETDSRKQQQGVLISFGIVALAEKTGQVKGCSRDNKLSGKGKYEPV